MAGFQRQADYESTIAQDDVFLADSLPDFASSTILPRKMKKAAVMARMEESRNPEEGVEHGKSFDKYKISLLKSSLQHYDDLAMEKTEREEKYKSGDNSKDKGTLMTLEKVRKAVSKWKKKTDVQLPINPAVMSPAKSPSRRSGFSPTRVRSSTYLNHPYFNVFGFRSILRKMFFQSFFIFFYQLFLF